MIDQYRFFEAALTSIERETEYHVLASVEEHTNQALAQNSTSTEEGDERNSDEAEISLPDTGIRNREGRTLHLKTNNGNKRVFIPRGWMFCTIQPPKCFSKKKSKKLKVVLNVFYPISLV
ncbi:hypothetical protein P5673_010680 [Acropora cervicornis]|uniref:Uncharacterized protein n=1 Tax=Acropora cervicornis TaxID=6130 RepID=A0AAD9QQC8_ACRCE|nr:hypothetical protein P5673_010680 [Acropora cervicornis]